MIKSIEKLKVRIDQNLNRAEKSEALSEDVVKIEARISSLKQVSFRQGEEAYFNHISVTYLLFIPFIVI